VTAQPWLKENGGVLTLAKHGRLIATLDVIAKDARIPKELLWKALPVLSADEHEWLRSYPEHRSKGYCGLLVMGETHTLDPLSRFGAYAGFLSRNMVRARIFTLVEALQHVKDGDPVVASCLMIPDFITAKKNTKEIPAWQMTALLTERWGEGKTQTVLYAPSMEAIGSEYGSYTRDFIRNHFKTVQL
jgi:hypothetical protein